MGALYLAGYIATIGVATFLLKYVSDDFSPYQLNLIMATGMVAIGLPALLIAEGTLALPRARLPLAGLIGVLMAAGSICFVLAIARLPVGLASAVATAYVGVVAVLGWIVLDEPMSAVKVAGIGLTVAGVALLSYAA